MTRYKEEALQRLNDAMFDKYSLPDLSDFSVSKIADKRKKFQEFLGYVGNPYLFRVGDIGVHVAFSGGNAKSLQDSMFKILSSNF